MRAISQEALSGSREAVSTKRGGLYAVLKTNKLPMSLLGPSQNTWLGAQRFSTTFESKTQCKRAKIEVANMGEMAGRLLARSSRPTGC